jgi:hypothetical protein
LSPSRVRITTSLWLTSALFGLTGTLCFSSLVFSQAFKPSYSGYTNNLEIVDRAIELADSIGFKEVMVPADIVRARLECGVYEEDYAMMPGTVGEHSPSVWTQGPDYPFNHLLPLTKIPFGVLTDPWSGWYRGFSHGYDPLTGYRWPNAQGNFGHYTAQNGNPVYPVQLGSIIGPGQIGDRYTEVTIYSTATVSAGTVIPRQTLEAMCDSLVPKAAEFSAGLLYWFSAVLSQRDSAKGHIPA